MGDQERAKISLKSMRDVQFTSIQKKQDLRVERNIKTTGKQTIIIHYKGRKSLSSAVQGTRTWDLSFMK